MSTTVKGNVSSPNGSRFAATFIIDEIMYTFSGNFSPNTSPFNVAGATLRYTDQNELSGSHHCFGQVGTSKVTIAYDNGLVIEGPLPDNAQFDPASTIEGHGVWTSG
jgi:hypothetical protein